MVDQRIACIFHPVLCSQFLKIPLHLPSCAGSNRYELADLAYLSDTHDRSVKEPDDTACFQYGSSNISHQ